MVTYKSITLNLDKKMIYDIETLMNQKIVQENGIVFYNTHTGNKQDFYRKLLTEGIRIFSFELEDKNLEYQQKLRKMRIKYGDSNDSSTESTKATKKSR